MYADIAQFSTASNVYPDRPNTQMFTFLPVVGSDSGGRNEEALRGQLRASPSSFPRSHDAPSQRPPGGASSPPWDPASSQCHRGGEAAPRRPLSFLQSPREAATGLRTPDFPQVELRLRGKRPPFPFLFAPCREMGQMVDWVETGFQGGGGALSSVCDTDPSV